MDVLKYITVILVVFLGGGDTGGHGGTHHDHVKLHVPEFIHHDHHTKVITIHHHHHKPKEKHHHHHHHHHHKPHVPYGHHYHKHHKKSHTKTQTSTSGHGQGHNSHNALNGYHKQHGNRGNYGHRQHHDPGLQSHTPTHHDIPSFNYDPNPVTFHDDYKPFAPPVPATIPQTPQVYGVEHTVKQVKVFDSLPGALPSNTGSHGYEVTEEGEQSEDDAFTAINSLSQTYPGTFGFVRNAGIDPAQNEVLADFPVQSSLQANHDPFGSAPLQPTSYANSEMFSTGQADPFSSIAPSEDISPSISSQFPLNIEATGFDDSASVYSGDITGTALVSTDDALNEDTPVSFSREAGIQETINTGDVETVVY